MIKRLLFLAGAWLLALSTYGQTFSEIGFTVGGSGYQGDLIDPPYRFQRTRPAFGAGFRMMLQEEFGIYANFIYGRISGSDLDFDIPYRQRRALEMESDLFEFAVHAEYHFLGRTTRIYRYNVYDRFWSPFISIGVGMAYAPQEIKSNGGEFRIPIPEPMDPSLFFTTPVRVGVRYDYSRNLAFTAEVGSRPVFSDLLDGVSQNGRSDKNDWYVHGALGIYFVMGGRE